MGQNSVGNGSKTVFSSKQRFLTPFPESEHEGKKASSPEEAWRMGEGMEFEDQD